MNKRTEEQLIESIYHKQTYDIKLDKREHEYVDALYTLPAQK